MNYLPFNNYKNNNVAGCYVFDKSLDDISSVNLEVCNQANLTFLFINLTGEFSINFNLSNDSNVKFLFIQKDSAHVQFRGNVHENSSLIVYYAEFSSTKFDLITDIHLVGSNATCNWNLASLSKDEDRKQIDVSVFHDFANTSCLINNFGVARDLSKLSFSGICKICNGSHHSKAHQNAKIMVFDKESDAIVKPILKIDDNDIEASHAAIAGKISDEQLFYLCSRGLSLVQARELITLGYLKPIMDGFDLDEHKEEIRKLIEGSL